MPQTCDGARLVLELDFNRLLLLIACLSPLVVLARTWKRAAPNRSWRIAAVGVLLVTAVAWLIAPGYAGFIGGAVWLLLLFIPAGGLRKARELEAQQRYRGARRLVSCMRLLHPAAAVREWHSLLVALERCQRGELEQGQRLLENLGSRPSRVSLRAQAECYRIRGDWAPLVTFCRQHMPLVALGSTPELLPLYLRALGETGAIDEAVVQMAGRAPALLAAPEHQPTFHTSVLLMLAFCGHTPALQRLLSTEFGRLAPDAKEFWIGTCELAAGHEAAGRARLERLGSQTRDALIRSEIAPRLAHARAVPFLSRQIEATLRRFERNVAVRRGSLLAPSRGGLTRAVTAIIALNLAMFGVEIWLGGSTDYNTLHRLGALEPYAVLARGEYWRMLAALFLHYGALHLLFNAYALYVLGPPLERVIGAARFATSYLAAGLGSSAGVVALWRFGWTQADVLVGASGSVMGIVGVWAGLLLRNHRLPTARRRLLSIGLIVAMQTMFDLYTPQVSMAAHLCGLATGFIVGLFVARPAEAL